MLIRWVNFPRNQQIHQILKSTEFEIVTVFNKDLIRAVFIRQSQKFLLFKSKCDLMIGSDIDSHENRGRENENSEPQNSSSCTFAVSGSSTRQPELVKKRPNAKGIQNSPEKILVSGALSQARHIRNWENVSMVDKGAIVRNNSNEWEQANEQHVYVFTILPFISAVLHTVH